jgi:hypothetical protein
MYLYIETPQKIYDPPPHHANNKYQIFQPNNMLNKNLFRSTEHKIDLCLLPWCEGMTNQPKRVLQLHAPLNWVFPRVPRQKLNNVFSAHPVFDMRWHSC